MRNLIEKKMEEARSSFYKNNSPYKFNAREKKSMKKAEDEIVRRTGENFEIEVLGKDAMKDLKAISEGGSKDKKLFDRLMLNHNLEKKSVMILAKAYGEAQEDEEEDDEGSIIVKPGDFVGYKQGSEKYGTYIGIKDGQVAIIASGNNEGDEDFLYFEHPSRVWPEDVGNKWSRKDAQKWARKAGGVKIVDIRLQN